ncbi:MAG: hypothetical protein ABWY93_05895 [Mycobacterium sp.]
MSDRPADVLHPPHDAGRRVHLPTQIVAEWPAGTFLENLALAQDGESWLVTSPSDNAVYRVGPGGSVQVTAEFDRAPTGIATHPEMGTLVAVGTQGRPDCQLFRITADGPQWVCDLPGVLAANGMVWDGDRLLVADSARSLVVSVDPTDGTTTVWLEHELLTPRTAESKLPGINGLAVHDGRLVMSSTDRGLILRTPIASTEPASQLEVVAERLVADDFAVADDGRIFFATHTFHSVLCLHPDGRREDVATHADGIAGPTAVAMAAGSSPALYVTTTGGLLSPANGEVEPARLVRVDVSNTRPQHQEMT